MKLEGSLKQNKNCGTLPSDPPNFIKLCFRIILLQT
jgi:hypothetical protein